MAENDDVADKLTLPKFKNISINQMYPYQTKDADTLLSVEDFEEVHERLNKARTALFWATDKMAVVERKYLIAKAEFDREWRKSYIEATGKTEKQRESRAFLECELLENTVISAHQTLVEFKRACELLRTEIGVLQTISSNLRSQMTAYPSGQ